MTHRILSGCSLARAHPATRRAMITAKQREQRESMRDEECHEFMIQGTKVMYLDGFAQENESTPNPYRFTQGTRNLVGERAI